VLVGITITGEEKLVSVTLGAVNRGKELVSITAVVRNELNDSNVSVIGGVSTTTVVAADWDVSLGEMKGVKLSSGVTIKEGVNITLAVATVLNTGVVTTKDGMLLSSAIVAVNMAEGVITGVESTRVDSSGNRLVKYTGVVVKTAAILVGLLNKDVVSSTRILDDGSIIVIDGVGIILVLSTTDEATKEGEAVSIVSIVKRSEVTAVVNKGAVLNTGCVVSILGINVVGTAILVVSISVTAVVKTISKFGSGISVSNTAACLFRLSCNLLASVISSPSTVINHLSTIFCNSSSLSTDSSNSSSL